VDLFGLISASDGIHPLGIILDHGIAVHFAVTHGIYRSLNELWASMPRSGRVMYVGALIYLVYGSLGLYIMSAPVFNTIVNSTH
jgi:hypothetical protein